MIWNIFHEIALQEQQRPKSALHIKRELHSTYLCTYYIVYMTPSKYSYKDDMLDRKTVELNKCGQFQRSPAAAVKHTTKLRLFVKCVEKWVIKKRQQQNCNLLPRGAFRFLWLTKSDLNHRNLGHFGQSRRKFATKTQSLY